MPRVPVPPEIDEFLAAAESRGRRHRQPARHGPHGGDLVRLGGRPRPAQHGRVRLRLGYLRANPSVSLTVLALTDWYRHVTLLGPVVSIEEDEGLRDIDRLAMRYTGKPYGNRENKRFTAWMEPERWTRWPPPR